MAKKEFVDDDDLDWWQDAGNRLGWILYGWTYKSGASFYTDDPSTRNPGTIQISGSQMQQILDALTLAKGE